MKARRIAMLAMISCLAFVGRMSFSFIPNVQPTTVMILIVTLYLGLADGLMVAILSMIMSNLYLGMGIWTIPQIVSYAVIVVLFYTLSRKLKDEWYLAFLVSISGLVYGFLISLMQAPFIGWNAFIPYYISGLPYDISHAIGNLMFFIVLHQPLKPVITKYINI